MEFLILHEFLKLMQNEFALREGSLYPYIKLGPDLGERRNFFPQNSLGGGTVQFFFASEGGNFSGLEEGLFPSVPSPNSMYACTYLLYRIIYIFKKLLVTFFLNLLVL